MRRYQGESGGKAFDFMMTNEFLYLICILIRHGLADYDEEPCSRIPNEFKSRSNEDGSDQ